MSWLPYNLITGYIVEPLNLWIHGGALGVAIFFLVSGFVIPYAAQNETRTEFAIKRFARIYPPFLISVFFLIAVRLLTGHSYILINDTSFLNFLLSATFFNFFLDIPGINDVAWTLIIEVLFYLWFWLIMPLFFKKPAKAIFIALSASTATSICLHFHAYAHILKWVNSIGFLFMGSLIFLRWSKKISLPMFLLSSMAFWLLFLSGINSTSISLNQVTALATSYALACLIFGVTLLSEPYLKLNRPVAYISKISYSVYLYHNKFGAFILYMLMTYIGYSLALPIVLSTILILSSLSFYLVERPSQKFARKVIDRLRNLNHSPLRVQVSNLLRDILFRLQP